MTYRAAPSPFHIAILMPITCLWLVGQSNAINLLDNMDGMCPAIAGTSAVGIAAVQAQNGANGPMTFAIVIAGACFGLPVWNRRPARVFLGDNGFAGAGQRYWHSSRRRAPGEEKAPPWGRGALPILLLSVPLLNTIFVMITRHDAGVPVSRGLADHSNYRLVAHGFGPNQAVLIRCGVAAASALTAFTGSDPTVGASDLRPGIIHLWHWRIFRHFPLPRERQDDIYKKLHAAADVAIPRPST